MTSRSSAGADNGVLEGIQVLDLTGYLGQMTARVLGDLGADVVKVEPPGGDPARKLGPFAGGNSDPEKSLRFIHANRSLPIRAVNRSADSPPRPTYWSRILLLVTWTGSDSATNLSARRTLGWCSRR